MKNVLAMIILAVIVGVPVTMFIVDMHQPRTKYNVNTFGFGNGQLPPVGFWEAKEGKAMLADKQTEWLERFEFENRTPVAMEYVNDQGQPERIGLPLDLPKEDRPKILTNDTRPGDRPGKMERVE